MYCRIQWGRLPVGRRCYQPADVPLWTRQVAAIVSPHPATFPLTSRRSRGWTDGTHSATVLPTGSSRVCCHHYCATRLPRRVLRFGFDHDHRVAQVVPHDCELVALESDVHLLEVWPREGQTVLRVGSMSQGTLRARLSISHVRNKPRQMEQRQVPGLPYARRSARTEKTLSCSDSGLPLALAAQNSSSVASPPIRARVP